MTLLPCWGGPLDGKHIPERSAWPWHGGWYYHTTFQNKSEFRWFDQPGTRSALDAPIVIELQAYLMSAYTHTE